LKLHRDGDRSGFEGVWVNNPTRFSNQYFKLLKTMEWKPKTLGNGLEQFVYWDEDSEMELMMLPTDMALISDPVFRKWVDVYAEDKDRFFEDFKKVFEKLMDLGVRRDGEGRITNSDNEKGGYHSAPKKSSKPGSLGRSSDDKQPLSEAEPLKEKNKAFSSRL